MSTALVPSPALFEDEPVAATSGVQTTLLVDRSNLPMTAKRLAQMLASAGNLYVRGGQVVRIVRTQVGAYIEAVNVDGIIVEAHRVCQPFEDKRRRGQVVREKITLPAQVARLYLNLGEDLNLNVLHGVCEAPLLSGDGSFNCAEGYVSERGLWCIGAEIPLVPDWPTMAEASEALATIRKAFASFPFADSTRVRRGNGTEVDLSRVPGLDESAFLVGLMTAVCRQSLPFAPALLIRAPQLSGSGTGKGLLVRALAQIAFGKEAAAFTSRGDRQELTKCIESTLLESGPIVFLDNCNGEVLASNVLAQVITESRVNVRLLGRSKMQALNTNAFIAVTGNAVQVSEDLTRRFLVVDLDAHCENPERRDFDESFKRLISSRRAELAAATITIWRWGRQNELQRGLPLGSFEQWARWCRDPLLALGCLDPVERVVELRVHDPQRQRIAALFQAWHEAHGSAEVRLRDIHQSVCDLIQGNRQMRASRLAALEGTRVAGFVFEVRRPVGRWSLIKYALRSDERTQS